MPHKLKQLDLKALLLSGSDVKIAVFVDCERCIGEGNYPVHHKGGPYGLDRTYLETCRLCYQTSGKRLQMVPLKELVATIKEMKDVL